MMYLDEFKTLWLGLLYNIKPKINLELMIILKVD